MVATLEERVAYLEGRLEEHSKAWEEHKDLTLHLDQKVDRFRDELSSRIDALDQKVDRFRDELSSRIDALDQKVDRFRDELSSRIDALDQKVDRFRDELSSRIDALDQKVNSRIDTLDKKFSYYFIGIIGIQVSILVTIIINLWLRYTVKKLTPFLRF
jgi:chromosome segregation ATPase